MSDETAPPNPKEVVLGERPSARGRVALYAGVAAAVLHLGAAVAVAVSSRAEPPRKRSAPPMVMFEHVVELEPAPAPPPPPAIEEKPPPRAKAKPAEPVTKAPEPPPEERAAPPAAPPPDAPPSEPPPAAQAGQVVAQAPEAAAPSFDIATGSGPRYAGGTTSASGQGTQANHTGQVGVGNGNGLSRARAAQLRTRDWPCGWPPEAEELDLEEAFVTIRASVRADGTLADVQVMSDPGYGFGRRAAWCARSKVKFEPALDAAGNAIAGTTPPLRVRFVRED